VDVVRLRKNMSLTQLQFARRFGFPVGTLRHWEHGTRRPKGASLVLLNVIKRDPGAVFRALRPNRGQEI
jgi:putative transcriptional regulator